MRIGDVKRVETADINLLSPNMKSTKDDDKVVVGIRTISSNGTIEERVMEKDNIKTEARSEFQELEAASSKLRHQEHALGGQNVLM